LVAVREGTLYEQIAGFENKGLRRILGPRRDEVREELLYLYKTRLVINTHLTWRLIETQV
jgi:hypothetical protein